jgi:hypothetical protein
MRPSTTPPSATAASRVALALYPPSWRARYGDEVRALLDESGGGLHAIASVAWRSAPAWIFPPRNLHDRPARMRTSLATVLVAWSVLTGLGLVFAQLAQFQGYRPAGHPIVGWAYAVFDIAFAVSVLAVAVGGLPVWLLMLRRACRERRPRDLACLLLPVAAPAVYLIALVLTVRLIGAADGVSPWWFLAVTLAGFAAAGISATGPCLALRRLRPAGPALRLAVTAACLAAVAMLVAAVAIMVAVIGLCQWAHDFAGYHDGTWPGVYLALVAAATTAITVSASRGARAAFAGAGGR